jgi:hypothetical protein
LLCRVLKCHTLVYASGILFYFKDLGPLGIAPPRGV